MTPIRILDPGLRKLGGHHHDIDLRLALELLDRGYEVTLHGWASADPELIADIRRAGVAFLPTFRVSAYADLARGQSYLELARKTNEDLREVPDDGLWLWPTLAPYQLLAAALHSRHPGQLGWLHQRPYTNKLRARTWVLAAELSVSAQIPVVLGAFEPMLRDAFAAFSRGLTVELLPLPYGGAPNPRKAGTLRRIGFFGNQRKERGIELLEPLICRLLALGYEVLLQDCNGVPNPWMDDPGLTVLGFVPDFRAAVASCDLLVWPSRSEKYRMRISGVVCEAIASGVPVVVPSGCGPAALTEKYGCGTLFHEFTVESVLEAIAEAASGYPALSSAARLAAIRWGEEHGIGRLAAMVSAHAEALR